MRRSTLASCRNCRYNPPFSRNRSPFSPLPCSTANSSSKTSNSSSRTARTATPRPMSIGSSPWKNSGRTLQSQLDEANRKANETARSIGKAPPEQREALKEEGRRIREEAAADPAEARPDHGRIGHDRADDSQSLARPRPRSGSTTRPIWNSSAARRRFRSSISSRWITSSWQGETRFDRLRRRGPRGGARLLLPQERRRAAGTGLAALCAGGAAQGRLHAA